MGSVTYSTFDPSSLDVLRLNFAPESVWSGGRPLARRNDLEQDGYTLDEASNVVRVRHGDSRDVDIQGPSEDPVPLFVDFDNPHVGANVPLRGEYPSGVIDWGEGAWKVCPPAGRMSTFSLCAADPKAEVARFRFFFERILLGADVYNPTTKDIVLTIRSPQLREVVFVLKAGQLQRIRTGWGDRVTGISLEAADLPSLRFDNLAYSLYLAGRVVQPE